MNRDEICPTLFRPPVRFFTPSTSDFSGRCLVISSRDTTLMNRRDAVVGLYFFIAMVLNLRVLGNLLALLQRHVRLFPIRPIAGESSAAAQFPNLVGRPDTLHLHLE